MYILMIGAHPDDVECNAGGSAALWRRRGDEVRFLTLTDGRLGHYDPEYASDPGRLIARRRAESEMAASVIGASTRNFEIVEGEVSADPQTMQRLIREMRAFGAQPGSGPDLIVTHRPNDRARDHRYTAQLVLDAVGLLTAPLLCPDMPPLARTPVLAYWYDPVVEPVAFRADVIVGIDTVLDEKTRMFGSHVSQVFEWLPHNSADPVEIPTDEQGRLEWLRETWIEPLGLDIRAAASESLHATLPHGRAVEAFQISDYGRHVSATAISSLFPVH